MADYKVAFLNGEWSFKFSDGTFLRGRTEEEVRRKVDALLNSSISGSHYRFLLSEDRSLSYERKSRSDVDKKRGNYKKGIDAILNRIKLGVEGGAAIGKMQVMQDIASRMVNEAYERGAKYNEYSGRLRGSYVATVIHGRKAVAKAYVSGADGSFGNITSGNNGGVYADLQSKRHEPSKFIYRRHYYYQKLKGGKVRRRELGAQLLKKYKYPAPGKYMRPKDTGPIVRYLRKWERNGSFRNRSSQGGFSPSYLERPMGSGRIQSGIVLENVAPYAKYLERTRYKVMNKAIEQRVYGYGRKATKLVEVATINTLRKAGFKIR